MDSNSRRGLSPLNGAQFLQAELSRVNLPATTTGLFPDSILGIVDCLNTDLTVMADTFGARHKNLRNHTGLQRFPTEKAAIREEATQ